MIEQTGASVLSYAATLSIDMFCVLGVLMFLVVVGLMKDKDVLLTSGVLKKLLRTLVRYDYSQRSISSIFNKVWSFVPQKLPRTCTLVRRVHFCDGEITNKKDAKLRK